MYHIFVVMGLVWTRVVVWRWQSDPRNPLDIDMRCNVSFYPCAHVCAWTSKSGRRRYGQLQDRKIWRLMQRCGLQTFPAAVVAHFRP